MKRHLKVEISLKEAQLKEVVVENVSGPVSTQGLIN